jgi:hypothetical protein
LNRLDPNPLSEVKPERAAERGCVMILPSAGDAHLEDLELPARLGDFGTRFFLAEPFQRTRDRGNPRRRGSTQAGRDREIIRQRDTCAVEGVLPRDGPEQRAIAFSLHHELWRRRGILQRREPHGSVPRDRHVAHEAALLDIVGRHVSPAPSEIDARGRPDGEFSFLHRQKLAAPGIAVLRSRHEQAAG